METIEQQGSTQFLLCRCFICTKFLGASSVVRADKLRVAQFLFMSHQWRSTIAKFLCILSYAQMVDVFKEKTAVRLFVISEECLAIKKTLHGSMTVGYTYHFLSFYLLFY